MRVRVRVGVGAGARVRLTEALGRVDVRVQVGAHTREPGLLVRLGAG